MPYWLSDCGNISQLSTSNVPHKKDGLEEAELHIELGEDPVRNREAALWRMMAKA